MKTDKQLLGAWGEEQASLFLIKAGYEILQRNYSVKQGEVDIIAKCPDWKKGKAMCFIEVKAREFDDGSAERAVDKEKQQRMFRAAKIYCFENDIDIDRTPIQFEQVSVIGRPGDLSPVIRENIIPVE